MQNLTEVLRVLVFIVGAMFLHIPVGVMKQDMKVEGGVLFTLRCRMHQSRADFGYSSGSLEAFGISS